jgi:RNA polymerase sigma-70 factor (ECF subfamily)
MQELGPNETFARLFAQHERRLCSYILSLLGNWQAAEDVFQDTCAIMWAKFAEFQPNTDFASWACRIAHFEVLKYREKYKRRLPLVTDEFLATVAAAQESEAAKEDDWLVALEECANRLSVRDREIIARRYSIDCTIKELASQLNIPANTLYKALGRIHKSLLDCVQQAVTQGERL